MELANSIVTLQPGMYILRHPKTGMPAISISRAAARIEHNGQIQALYTPGTDGAVLRDGHDCIVMQVLQAPVDLLVTAYLEKAGTAVPTLKIDRIALDGAATAIGGNVTEVAPKGISIIGHVEKTGDVVAGPGQRLGDPASNLRIEGFLVEWPDKPDGVELAYSARIEGVGETPFVQSGKFCGTRHEAKRIVGISFRLTGPSARQYELQGSASFSGGFEAALEAGATLSGPSGLEHMTALALNVQRATSKKLAGSWEPSSRTKVFKARGINQSRDRVNKSR